MRRYGSMKRNPNPPWPNQQSVVVVPPGVSKEAIGQIVPEDSDASMQAESIHRGDDLVQIMGIMPRKDMNLNLRNNSNNTVSEYLKSKTGRLARIEFLFGENTHIEKTGVIESVGRDFVVLSESGTKTSIICPMKNIKFLNIYNI